ncbi:hypothetical protein LEL_10806 [Akanthomyces lecanii RCEF 1005]|uniref:Uncharacterized protein n=1 Tax=Akanthomyces lecanii RCEF 1005 TaxID=1081108 RepID=A0A167T2P9_CORDF|nr:hypothetical protein LEL_10806 [Akanthomyces lecanii RCEF 1005]
MVKVETTPAAESSAAQNSKPVAFGLMSQVPVVTLDKTNDGEHTENLQTVARDAKASSGANASIPSLMEDHGQEHAENHRGTVFLQSAAAPPTTGIVFRGAGLATNAPKIGRTPGSQDLSQTKTVAHNTSRVEIVVPASDNGSEVPIGQAIISAKLAGKAKRQTRGALRLARSVKEGMEPTQNDNCRILE